MPAVNVRAAHHFHACWQGFSCSQRHAGLSACISIRSHADNRGINRYPRKSLPDSEEERFLRQACGIWPGLPYKTRQSLLRVLIATGIVVMCVGQKDEFQGLRRWGITVRRRMHEFPNQSRSRSVFLMPYSWLVLFYVRQFQSVSFHFVLPLQPKPEYQRKDSE